MTKLKVSESDNRAIVMTKSKEEGDKKQPIFHLEKKVLLTASINLILHKQAL